MSPFYLLDRFLVLSHVAAGFTGLVVAPLAMLAVKGGRAHRLWGKIFFWSMFWIFVSTLGIMFFRFNFFLAVIAILSFYSALTGYRALYRKRPQTRQSAGLDRLDCNDYGHPGRGLERNIRSQPHMTGG